MAFFKGSYYETTALFEPPEDSRPAFRGLRGRSMPLPEAVLEHSVSVGDRLDQLGQNYYANPRDWRRLADCNTDAIFPEDLIYTGDGHADAPDLAAEKIGKVVLVPRRREIR